MRKIPQLVTSKVKTVALFLVTLVVVSLITSCKKEDIKDTNQSLEKEPSQQILFYPPQSSITNHVEWESELDMTKTEEGYLTLRIKIPHRKANDGKIYDLEYIEDITLDGQWEILGDGIGNKGLEVLTLSTNKKSFNITQDNPKPEGSFIYLEHQYGLTERLSKGYWKIGRQWISGKVKYRTTDPLDLNTNPKPKEEEKKEKKKTPVPIRE